MLTCQRFIALSWAMIKDDWNSTIFLGTAAALDAVCHAVSEASTSGDWSVYWKVLLKAVLFYWGYALVHCSYNQLHCGKCHDFDECCN
jgi:hypothetical protein